MNDEDAKVTLYITLEQLDNIIQCLEYACQNHPSEINQYLLDAFIETFENYFRNTYGDAFV